MRHLNVGGTTYDTVGEASVTQVLSSGTKIATVSIDGTATDLYAPAGGSSVDPATAAPSMDGTAAVGSSVKYAREDHVHPSDTSKQATLVSGTNIKTINNESLLGSGNITTPTYTLPTASTSTLGGVKVDGTTITAAADGTISASGGGGGSTVTLYTNGSYSNLWTDQSLSTTLLDYAGYDYKAAYDILHDSSSVYVENSNNNQRSARYGVVLAAFFDSTDETLYALVAHEMANISSSTIGSVLRHVSCS